MQKLTFSDTTYNLLIKNLGYAIRYLRTHDYTAQGKQVTAELKTTHVFLKNVRRINKNED